MRHALFSLFLSLAVLGPAWAQPAETKPVEDLRNYVLRARDTIRVQVFQETDLDRELRISQDGTISLPLIGSVACADRTVREIEAEIRRRYDADFLVNPQINVSVVEYAPRWVNVMGMVNSPGAIPIPPEEKLSLLDAITRAGGFTRLGDRRRVRITRTDADGQARQHEINIDRIMNGASDDPWLLQPGDQVFVPERRS